MAWHIRLRVSSACSKIWSPKTLGNCAHVLAKVAIKWDLNVSLPRSATLRRCIPRGTSWYREPSYSVMTRLDLVLASLSSILRSTYGPGTWGGLELSCMPLDDAYQIFFEWSLQDCVAVTMKHSHNIPALRESILCHPRKALIFESPICAPHLWSHLGELVRKQVGPEAWLKFVLLVLDWDWLIAHSSMFLPCDILMFHNKKGSTWLHFEISGQAKRQSCQSWWHPATLNWLGNP